MNKLEERIFNEFNNPDAYSLYNKPGFLLEEHFAKIAAKICLEIAEKAYKAGMADMRQKASLGGRVVTFDQFKQEIL